MDNHLHHNDLIQHPFALKKTTERKKGVQEMPYVCVYNND